MRRISFYANKSNKFYYQYFLLEKQKARILGNWAVFLDFILHTFQARVLLNFHRPWLRFSWESWDFKNKLIISWSCVFQMWISIFKTHFQTGFFRAAFSFYFTKICSSYRFHNRKWSIGAELVDETRKQRDQNFVPGFSVNFFWLLSIKADLYWSRKLVLIQSNISRSI